MKFLITESIIKKLLFKKLDEMELTPHTVECVGGTGCIDLNDKHDVTIFRIDTKNNCFYNGEVLYVYSDIFDISPDELAKLLKEYLIEVLGYKIKSLH